MSQIGDAAAEARCSILDSDRKSTRLNSSHTVISYAVFCLKKKQKNALYPLLVPAPELHPLLLQHHLLARPVAPDFVGVLRVLREHGVAFAALFFFFNDTATTEIYTRSLHDALPICAAVARVWWLLEHRLHRAAGRAWRCGIA